MKTPRSLGHAMTAYRIGDPLGEYPIYGGEGSKDYPGRWNNANEEMIYTSEHYSTAMLEKLIYTGEMPPNQHFIEVRIPSGASYEVVTNDSLPGWWDANRAIPRQFGSDWLNQKRSAILLVPSVVARLERNLLINPNHPQSKKIKPGAETPIWWDDRLFKK